MDLTKTQFTKFGGICEQCKRAEFNDQRSYELHMWEHHPSDAFQEHWSELKKSGKLAGMSLAYQDDPYH